MDLQNFVNYLARGIKLADSRLPVAVSTRSKVAYQPGIGPHTESETLRLAIEEFAAIPGASDLPAVRREVRYPVAARRSCDVVLGDPVEWAIEVKMLRMLGDNGKPNDNILMHILSPYPSHRSAVTDCAKLLDSGLAGRKGIVIFGYEYPAFPLAPAIEAFEALASRLVTLRAVEPATADGLTHPVHRDAVVFGWEISTV